MPGTTYHMIIIFTRLTSIMLPMSWRIVEAYKVEQLLIKIREEAGVPTHTYPVFSSEQFRGKIFKCEHTTCSNFTNAQFSGHVTFIEVNYRFGTFVELNPVLSGLSDFCFFLPFFNLSE